MTTCIPIFPLNTVLYPGGLLPLKIFEQRYLDMTKTCVRDAAPFGVCRIREGREVGLPAVPEQIGCTALITQWEMPHLSVFHLRTRGQQPFRILRHTTQSDGLIRAEIELLAEAAVRGEQHVIDGVLPGCRHRRVQPVSDPPTQLHLDGAHRREAIGLPVDELLAEPAHPLGQLVG